MILKNKKALILSSALILLPIPVGLLLWDRFPEEAASGLLVVVTPLIMLAAQWLCVFVTGKDPGNRDRNRKPLTMVLWIIPVVSNLCSGIMYALFLGADFAVENLMVPAMGLLFAVIGNYLPKCRMNATVGIKVPWAYSSEENWNATHRFGGKVWVIGGIIMMLSGLIPGAAGAVVMTVVMIVLAVVPILYSWCYYRREKASGRTLLPMFPATNVKILKGSAVFLVLLLAGVALLLCTGDLEYRFGEESFTVEASYYGDLTVSYDAIQTVEYRQDNVPGTRVGGFGSFRLLMGFFRNDEFGTHTRYTYYAPEACVVLTTDSRTIVLSGEDAAGTRAIYNRLLEKSS